MKARRRIGVYGAGTPQGVALLRAISTHPMAELAFAADRRLAGELIHDAFPGLRVVVRGAFVEEDAGLIRDADLIINANGLAGSVKLLPELLAGLGEGRLVDLSPLFRGLSKEQFEAAYKTRHPAPQWISEFHLATDGRLGAILSQAKLVGVPGAAARGLMAVLAPLADRDLLAGAVTVTAIAGPLDRELCPDGVGHEGAVVGRVADHPQADEALIWLGRGAVPAFSVALTPICAPVGSGLICTVTFDAPRTIAMGSLDGLWREFYGEHSFVALVSRSPSLADVAGSNRLHMSLRVAGDRVVACVALDSLGRGGALAALEAANVMLGLPEEAGLSFPGRSL